MPQDTDNVYTDPKENPDNFTRWTPQNTDKYLNSIYDRISELLLVKFTEIEPYLGANGLLSVQKTYKGGRLVRRTSDSDMLAVYQDDKDVNQDDEQLETLLLNWLEWLNPGELSIHISKTISDEDGSSEVDLTSPPEFLLNAPGKSSLNLSHYINLFDLKKASILDNVSQYMELKKTKTNINRKKLKEYVDTEFSELTPVTFTQLLERYTKFKQDIPFYRYRTEDFFTEYGNTSVPAEYRLEKWFEEFERIKDDIPRGSFEFQSFAVEAKGTGLNNHSTNTLKFIYQDGTIELVEQMKHKRGHNMIVFSEDSFFGGTWDGEVKHTEYYDTYSPHSNYAGWCKDIVLEVDGLPKSDGCRSALARDILNPDIIGTNDLVVITSYDAVGYTDYLVSALRTIGANNPQLVDGGYFEDEVLGFRLHGSNLSGWPNCEITINNQLVFNEQITHSDWRWYDVPLSFLSTPTSDSLIISVVFNNDAYQAGVGDRNLYFDKIRNSGTGQIFRVSGHGSTNVWKEDGTVIESSNMAYHNLNGNLDQGKTDSYKGHSVMAWSGFVRLNIMISDVFPDWSTDGNPNWNVRTPYALIGYGGAGRNQGTEMITNDSATAPPSIVNKSWPLRPTFQFKDYRTAAYIISEIQNLFPEQGIPFFSLDDVRAMSEEIENLRLQNAESVLSIHQLSATVDILEDGNLDSIMESLQEAAYVMGDLITSNGKSTQCVGNTANCGNWDYAGSPTQDLIYQGVGGYSDPPSDWFFVAGSKSTIKNTWWDVNHPAVAAILKSGVDHVGSLTLGNVFMSETNRGNKFSNESATHAYDEYNSCGQLLEFHNLDYSIRFIAERIFCGTPFSADDDGIFKIVYCFENGCGGQTGNVQLRVRVGGQTPSDYEPSTTPQFRKGGKVGRTKPKPRRRR